MRGWWGRGYVVEIHALPEPCMRLACSYAEGQFLYVCVLLGIAVYKKSLAQPATQTQAAQRPLCLQAIRGNTQQPRPP